MRHATRSRTSMMSTAIGCLAMVVMGWLPLAFVQGAEIAIEAAPADEVQTGDVLTIEVASETEENATPPATTRDSVPKDGEKISAARRTIKLASSKSMPPANHPRRLRASA